MLGNTWLPCIPEKAIFKFSKPVNVYIFRSNANNDFFKYIINNITETGFMTHISLLLNEHTVFCFLYFNMSLEGRLCSRKAKVTVMIVRSNV